MLVCDIWRTTTLAHVVMWVRCPPEACVSLEEGKRGSLPWESHNQELIHKLGGPRLKSCILRELAALCGGIRLDLYYDSLLSLDAVVVPSRTPCDIQY